MGFKNVSDYLDARVLLDIEEHESGVLSNCSVSLGEYTVLVKFKNGERQLDIHASRSPYEPTVFLKCEYGKINDMEDGFITSDEQYDDLCQWLFYDDVSDSTISKFKEYIKKVEQFDPSLKDIVGE